MHNIFYMMVLTLFSVLYSVAAVSAATITGGHDSQTGCNIMLEGVISQGDANRIKEVLDEIEERNNEIFHSGPLNAERLSSIVSPILCLNSPGGSYAEAIEISRMLLHNEIMGASQVITYIPQNAVCESACSIVFMSGSAGDNIGGTTFGRIMHPTARLGIHAPSLRLEGSGFSSTEVQKAYNLALRTVSETVKLRQSPFGPDFHRFPDSFVELFLETPSDTMSYVETVKQAVRWGISIFPVQFPDTTSPHSWLQACYSAEAFFSDSEPGNSQSFSFGAGQGEYEGPVPSVPTATAAASPGRYFEHKVNMGEGEECLFDISSGPDEWSTNDNVIMTIVYDTNAGLSFTRDFINPELLFYNPDTAIRNLQTRSSTLSDRTGDTFARFLRTQIKPMLTEAVSCWLTSPTARVTNVNEYVNLRRQPDFSARVIRQVPLGEQVRVLDPNRFWQFRDACGQSCQAFGRDPNNAAAMEQAQQCINDNMLWYEITDARGNRGWVSRKFLEEVE